MKIGVDIEKVSAKGLFGVLFLFIHANLRKVTHGQRLESLQ